MKDELITYNTAVLAKEKGFDEVCLDSFDSKGIPQNRYNIYIEEDIDEDSLQSAFELKNSDLKQDFVAAPTQSLLQRWLREVHNIQVYAYSTTLYMNNQYKDYVYNINGNSLDSRSGLDTYEEALEIGLQKALLLL